MTSTINGSPVAKRAEVAARRDEAVKLKTAGKTWREVADVLGYASPGAACKDVGIALRQRREELGLSLDDLRETEMERLDAVLRRVWKIMDTVHLAHSGGKIVTRVVRFAQDPATGSILLDDDGRPMAAEVEEVTDHGPVLAAAALIVRISESIRRLYGTDAPAKVQVTGTVAHQYGLTPETIDQV